ncbi:MAG TPA: twin-arginine translocase TatA/TatE family subunit [Terriglobales bacterium]|nr:twin-arginine translocase TatA/TatE family subunit [Terriglobales bacterium]
MSFGELLFLAMLALLVFGPRKLPEVARTVAKIMAELRKASNEFRYSLEDEIRSIEVSERSQKRLEASAPPAVVEGTIAHAAPPHAADPLPDDPAPDPPAPDHSEPAPAAALHPPEPVAKAAD